MEVNMSAVTILGPAPSSDATATPTAPIGLQDVDSRDTGARDIQKQDIHVEAVEHPVSPKRNGIEPIRRMLLNGFQGTLNAKPSKATINRTRAAYRRVADPIFFRKYFEETKRRISEGHASSETYVAEIRAIATSSFDAQTRTNRVVERIFAEICNQAPKLFRNIHRHRPDEVCATSPTFMEDLCAALDTCSIQVRADRMVERLFGEIWRQVQDEGTASKMIDARVHVTKRADSDGEDLLEQRFEVLGMSQEKMEVSTRIQLLLGVLEILDRDREKFVKEGKQYDEKMRETVKWVIYSTSQFMASFET